MKKSNKWMKTVTCMALAGTMMVGAMPPMDTKAAITASQQAALRQEMYQMIVTGDTTKHDVSSYGVTVSELSDIFDDLEKNEASIAIKVTANQFVSVTKENGYAKYMYLYNQDSGFQERYKKVQSAVSEIMDKIEPEMTDLEKLIIVHDYIVEHSYYKIESKTYISYVLGGPLGEGYGCCMGYADALIRVLGLLGIEADTVDSANHEWVKVKIDGEWYHVDPTWDDTRTRTYGETSHYFLMRNDKEYATSPYSPHASWDETVSKSTKYTDWYVHDIEGDMMYESGMWYYEKGGSICKNDIEGNSYKLVLAGTNMKLVDVEDGVITYKEGGKTYQSKVEGDSVSVEPKPTATSSAKPTATSTPKPTATSTPVPTEAGDSQKYTPVKCVEILSNDWQNSYFETGVNLKKDYDIECVYEFTDEDNRGSVFGYTTKPGTHVYLYQCAAKSVRVGYDWLYEWRDCNSVGEINVYKKQGIAIYLNGKKVVNGANITYKEASDIRLGTTKCKIYSTKIWNESGKLIRDYVPSLDEKGVVGLYDRANDEFVYYSSDRITYEQ